MDSEVKEEKIKLLDGIDFIDFITIRSCKDSVDINSSEVCKESEVFNAKISEQVKDMNDRLEFSCEEVRVYGYVYFIFSRMFDKYIASIEELSNVCEDKPDYVRFDPSSVFEEIISEFPVPEEVSSKYDVLELFDRIMSDSLRFPIVFYHRYWMNMYHKQACEEEYAYDTADEN